MQKGLDALFLIAYISSTHSTCYLGVDRKRKRAPDKAGQRGRDVRAPFQWKRRCKQQEEVKIMIAKGQQENMLVVEPDGKVVIPAQILGAAGIKAGAEIWVKTSTYHLTLALKPRRRPLDRQQLHKEFDRWIKEQPGDRKIKGDDPWLFGLTAAEYDALSPEEEEALWEQAYREESQRQDREEAVLDDENYPPLQPDFSTAGQRPGGGHAERSKTPNA